LESEEAGKKTVFYEEKGNWAVFRLLARAHVASSNNPKLYQLEFNLDHHDVTYDLLADNPVNAFIPDILTAFRCPEKL
jgi:type VI protein secretion system component VasK